MTKFFKIFDFYGTQFHWYFNNRPKYYTNYGGILSIISIISWVTVLVVLGYDDFKRMHPTSTISNIPPIGDKIIKFGEKKLYLPWRIIDYNEKFIDHKKILFPRIYYFTNKYNSNTGLMETIYLLLNYTLCNETSMKNLGNDFLINEQLDNLFCIDMEDLNMGGSWNSDYLNYIRLDLNLCKNGLNYNESNINCTRREYLNEKFGINNNWYFELFYPSVQFQPSNKELPIFVLYKSYYFGLSTSSNKVDRIYFQEHIFEDETGWVLDNDIIKRSYWGVSSIKSDYYTQSERDIFRYGSTSRLYSLKIFLDFGTVFYTRKYKKIYEIFSEIFPIMKAILAIFTYITEILNELKSSKKLNEFIINNNLDMFKPKKDIGENRYNRLFRNAKFKFGRQNSRSFKVISNKNTIPNYLKDSSLLSCVERNNKEKDTIVFNKKNRNVTERITKYRNTVDFNRSNSNLFEIFNKKNPNFPLNYYLYGYFMNKFNPKKDINYLCISRKFNSSFTYFTRLIDITSYIELYHQFKLMKKLIMENVRITKIQSDKKLSYNNINDLQNNNVLDN